MSCTFTSILETTQGGYPFMNMVFIPDDVVKELGLKANTRLIGTINGINFRLASLSNGAGQFYITINKQLQKSAGIKPGSKAHVVTTIDPHPDRLDVPEEFEALLDQDPEVKQGFEKLTIGYRRSVLHYISGAKSIDTRIRRSLELAERIRNGKMPGAKIKDH